MGKKKEKQARRHRFLVVDPDDGHHICYDTHDLGSALAFTSDGLVTYQPVESTDKKFQRKLFEEVIQYRQFLERHKDGTYKLEWVEGRWQGWMLHVESRGGK